MTLQLAMMPLFGPFKLGAALLMVAGIIYGIIEDVVATWVTKRYSSNRQGAGKIVFQENLAAGYAQSKSEFMPHFGRK
jgi:hypothetical protein